MPLARQTQQPMSLARMFGVEPEVGQQPSGIAFNDYLANIGPTNEQQREAGVLAHAGARTNASMANDLEEANAVEAARNMGFDGSYPLQEQAQWSADQKLRQILIPEQMKLQAAMLEKETGREFNASQGALDRASRERIATGSQATQMGKTQATQNGVAHRQAMDAWNKRGMFSKLGDWLSGAQPPQAPAGAAVTGNTVKMMDPTTGDTRDVPADRVNEYLARGAQVIN